jgi:hypothetical protein
MDPTPISETAAYTAFHCAVCDAEASYALAAYDDEASALDALTAALDSAYNAYDAATTPAAPRYRLAARRAGSVWVMRWDAGPATRTGWWTPVAQFQTAADALREFPTATNNQTLVTQ